MQTLQAVGINFDAGLGVFEGIPAAAATVLLDALSRPVRFGFRRDFWLMIWALVSREGIR